MRHIAERFAAFVNRHYIGYAIGPGTRYFTWHLGPLCLLYHLDHRPRWLRFYERIPLYQHTLCFGRLYVTRKR